MRKLFTRIPRRFEAFIQSQVARGLILLGGAALALQLAGVLLLRCRCAAPRPATRPD